MTSDYGRITPSGFYTPGVAQSSGFGPAVYGRPSPSRTIPTADTSGFGFGTLLKGGEGIAQDIGFGAGVFTGLREIPLVGSTAAGLVDEVTSPVNILLARLGGKGPLKAIRGKIPASGRPSVTSRARGLAANVLDSPVQGTFGQRLAGEALIGYGANVAAEELELPGPLSIAEPFIGGAIGLIALRQGQKKFPKSIFGTAPSIIDKNGAVDVQFADLLNNEMSLGGAKNQSHLGGMVASVLAALPLGDLTANPLARGRLIDALSEADNASSQFINGKLFFEEQKLTNDGGLFTGSAMNGSTPGMVDLDDLDITWKVVNGEEVLESAVFKNPEHNEGVKTFGEIMDGLDEVVQKLSGKKLDKLDFDGDSTLPVITKKALRNNDTGTFEIAMGEVIERHGTYATYFPRVTKFADRLARSGGTAERLSGDIGDTYQAMSDIAARSGKTLDETYWLDPNVVLHARVQGGLIGAKRASAANAVADLGITAKEQAHNNPAYVTASDKVKAERKAVDKLKRNRAKLAQQTRTLRGSDALIRRVAKRVYERLKTSGTALDPDGSLPFDVLQVPKVLSAVRPAIKRVISARDMVTDLRKSIRDIEKKIGEIERSNLDDVDAIADLGKTKEELKDFQRVLKGSESLADLLRTQMEENAARGLWDRALDNAPPEDIARFLERNSKTLGKLADTAEKAQSLFDEAEVMAKSLAEGIDERGIAGKELTNSLRATSDAIRVTKAATKFDTIFNIHRMFDKSLTGPSAAKYLKSQVDLADTVKQLGSAEEDLVISTLDRDSILSGLRTELFDGGRVMLAEDIQQMFPTLRGKTFTEAQSSTITSLVRGEFLPTDVGRQAMKINSFMRSAVATLDLSWYGIQGWAVMMSKPDVFFKTLDIALRSIKDPQAYQGYMNMNKEHVMEGVENGLAILNKSAPDEVMNAMPVANAIEGIAKRVGGDTLKKRVGVARTILDISDEAFSRAGNVARIELYKSMKATNGNLGALRKSNKPESSMQSIADAANQLTGITKDRVFDIERYGLFAPRYTRAMFKNILDAAAVSTNTDKSRLVRETMFTAMATTALATAFINYAITGESTDFQPVKNGKFNSNFMVIKNLGGRDINLYGPYRTNMRLIGDAFSGSPTEATVRFARGKSGPLASIVGDIIQGHDLSGNPIKLTSLQGVADTALAYSLSRVTPIALNDLAASVQEGGVTELLNPLIVADIAGFNSRERRSYSLKESLAQRRFNKPYADLTGQERDALRQENPEMFRLAEEELKKRAKYDPSAQSAVKANEINSERISKESQLQSKYSEGLIEPKQFREAMSALSLEAATKREVIRGDTGEPAPDDALGRFYQTFRDAEIAPGVIDWDLQDKLEAELRSSLTADQLRHIDERSGAEHPPEVQWYFNNKKIISGSGYWSSLDTAFNSRVGRFARSAGFRSYQELETALKRSESQGNVSASRKLQSFIDSVRRESDNNRRQLRTANPALDNALLQNGYVTVPILG